MIELTTEEAIDIISNTSEPIQLKAKKEAIKKHKISSAKLSYHNRALALYVNKITKEAGKGSLEIDRDNEIEVILEDIIKDVEELPTILSGIFDRLQLKHGRRPQMTEFLVDFTLLCKKYSRLQ